MQDSREYAMGLFQEAMAVANTQYGKAMQAITDRIDTSCIAAEEDPDSQSEGSGTGYGLTYFAGVPNPERGLGKTRVCHVFNPSAHPRREPVEVTLWDWTGDLRDLMAEDMGGRPMALQLLDQTQQFFWDHHYVRVLVDCTVPSCGYTTFVIREGEPQEYRIYYQKDSYRDPAAQPFVLENELIRAEFDYQNGRMVSLRDLQTGEELIAAGKSAGLQCIEAERSSSSAWAIGKYTDFHSELQLISIHPLTSGTLRQSFTAEYKVRNSTVKATVSLDAHARGVRYEWEVDWHEETRTGGQIPVLVYHFPVGYEIQHYLFDVPGGVQARGPLHLDMPGLQFGAAISRQRSSVALISTCKYGYRCADQALNATLIHTAPNPDPYPERGIHKIVEFVAVENRDVKSLCEMAYDCNHSMPTQSGYIHPGDLPASDSLFSFQCKDALVSSVTQTEGGKLLVRFYEINGNQAEAELTFLRKVRTAAAVDLEGAPTGIPVRVEKNRVYVAIPPYALVGMEVSLAEEDAGQ